eukprot:TRINITY_DN31121_c0_g2_i1.p1 TRINITY_DN31121_c0_g2~~TRINITY_DN31121_c0_g2_i1.p1  ORF type:complete len:239 (-),score=55.59 TRINITY_DN31121_c0_g2_i1:375-1091(-)
MKLLFFMLNTAVSNAFACYEAHNLESIPKEEKPAFERSILSNREFALEVTRAMILFGSDAAASEDAAADSTVIQNEKVDWMRPNCSDPNFYGYFKLRRTCFVKECQKRTKQVSMCCHRSVCKFHWTDHAELQDSPTATLRDSDTDPDTAMTHYDITDVTTVQDLLQVLPSDEEDADYEPSSDESEALSLELTDEEPRDVPIEELRVLQTVISLARPEPLIEQDDETVSYSYSTSTRYE